jgi:hypothetical protein
VPEVAPILPISQKQAKKAEKYWRSKRVRIIVILLAIIWGQ